MDNHDNNTEKMAALGRMTRSIIHDLNNSLASIMGHAEFLTFDLPQNSEQHIFAENIRKAGFQIQDLIDQIRAFAAEKNVAKDIHLDLIEETQNLSERLKGKLLPKQSISFSSDVEQAFLTLPPHQFRTFISNIVKNAIESLRENAGQVTIHVSSGAIAAPQKIYDSVSKPVQSDTAPSQSITITITDTGCGMDEDNMPVSFHTAPHHSGRGMGLSVASEIIKYLGGSLQFASTVNTGTSVTIVLPVESIEMKGNKTLSHRQKSVLLVDKNPDTLKTIATMLTRDSHKVKPISDGLEAIDMMRESPDAYDILITDSSIPHEDSVDLMTEIRQDFKNFPVIVMSGDMEFLENLKDKTAHQNTYILPKPITSNSLRKVIESAAK